MAFRQTVIRKYAHAQLVLLRKGKKVSCKTTVQNKINVKNIIHTVCPSLWCERILQESESGEMAFWNYLRILKKISCCLLLGKNSDRRSSQKPRIVCCIWSLNRVLEGFYYSIPKPSGFSDRNFWSKWFGLICKLNNEIVML